MDPNIVQYIQSQQSIIVDALTRWPSSLLAGTAAIGFIAMTFIEMSKVKWRAVFHKNAVQTWIDEANIIRDHDNDRQRDKTVALSQLILLATAGNKESLFSLSTENLCGQIAAAAQSVMDTPKSYRELFLSLLGPNIADKGLESEIEFVLSFTPRSDGKESDGQNQRYISSRNRLANLVQRNIDSLQIATSFQWKKLMRARSMQYSYFLSIVGTFLFASSSNLAAMAAFVLLSGYVGGFFASMFRDVLSAIERIKK